MFDSYTEPDPNAPREGDAEKERFYPKNLIGHSVLLWVNDHIQEVPGAVNADSPDGLDVTIVDLGPYGDPAAAWGFAGVHVIWQANSLIGKLKQRAGNPNPIVIYLGKGQPAQKGWQPPFILTDVSQDPQVRGKAEMWMQQYPDFAPNPPRQQPTSQPAGPASAPTPLPTYPQPQPTPAAPAPGPQSFGGPVPQGPPAPAGPGPIRSTPPYPESYPMPQQSYQPPLQPVDENEQYVAEASDRLARAHDPARNATLDSLRQRHGIPQPQQENPPF